MSLLEQIEQNPLLLDSEEVRAQVRNFPELDYSKAWDLYLRSKAHQTKAAKVLKTDPPKPLFLLPGLVVLNGLQWWQLITCLVVRSLPDFETFCRKYVIYNWLRCIERK